jgi:hypothetical protein
MKMNFIYLVFDVRHKRILLFWLFAQVCIFSAIGQTLPSPADTVCKKVSVGQTNQFRNIYYSEGDTSTIVFDRESCYAELMNTAFMPRLSRPSVSSVFSDPSLSKVYKLTNRQDGKAGAIRIHLVEDLINQPDSSVKNFVFTTKSPAEQCTTLMITNTKGEVVFERELEETQTTFSFNLDSLKKGIYLCSISQGIITLYAQKLTIAQ